MVSFPSLFALAINVATATGQLAAARTDHCSFRMPENDTAFLIEKIAKIMIGATAAGKKTYDLTVAADDGANFKGDLGKTISSYTDIVEGLAQIFTENCEKKIGDVKNSLQEIITNIVIMSTGSYSDEECMASKVGELVLQTILGADVFFKYAITKWIQAQSTMLAFVLENPSNPKNISSSLKKMFCSKDSAPEEPTPVAVDNRAGRFLL